MNEWMNEWSKEVKVNVYELFTTGVFQSKNISYIIFIILIIFVNTKRILLSTQTNRPS